MAELPHIGPFSVSASHRDVSMVPCVTVHVFSPSGLESSVSQAGTELTGYPEMTLYLPSAGNTGVCHHAGMEPGVPCMLGKHFPSSVPSSCLCW